VSIRETATILARALEHRDRIRRLAREYLSAEARRTYDSDDLVATVCRRVLEAGPTAESEAQIWEFIRAVAAHAATSQTRKAAVRSRRLPAPPDREPAAPDLSISEVLNALPDAEMQQVVALRYRGVRFRVIAGTIGISERTAFRRWDEARQIVAERGYDLVS
jgi:DNA-directed RNA polymerase specialized sigma24 family protein